MTAHWSQSAIEKIKVLRVAHVRYEVVVGDVFNALAAALPGEVVVVVGPSRVGKSCAITEALDLIFGHSQFDAYTRPHVLIQAENASTLGAFSTKAFMRAGCEAIEHPLYGVAARDDPWREKLDARIQRTSEGMLRSAFEHGLQKLKTRYVVVDEAHHVGYVPKPGAAVAILDSWKCLAQKTQTVLVLVGSYALLDILAQAPHLLGRQRPVEFPRYRQEQQEDLLAFAQVLEAWSAPLRFEEGVMSLRKWERLLFTHSFGCIGHLSMWLRSALARAGSRNCDIFSEALLLQTCLPASQEKEIAAEIFRGEQAFRAAETLLLPPNPPEKKAPARKSTRKPFQRATRRFPYQGRK